MTNPTDPAMRGAFEAHCETYGIFPRDAYFKLWQAAQAHARAEMEAEVARLRADLCAIEKVRTAIFYWMTRNHHRGEKSYDMLGKVKEDLTAILRTTLAEPQPTGKEE